MERTQLPVKYTHRQTIVLHFEIRTLDLRSLELPCLFFQLRPALSQLSLKSLVHRHRNTNLEHEPLIVGHNLHAAHHTDLVCNLEFNQHMRFPQTYGILLAPLVRRFSLFKVSSLRFEMLFACFANDGPVVFRPLPREPEGASPCFCAIRHVVPHSKQSLFEALSTAYQGDFAPNSREEGRYNATW